MPLTIQLEPSERQTACNFKRWRELLEDPDLARLPHRTETDLHGHILMSPPLGPSHGIKQAKIATLFDQSLPSGVVITECPVSTSDGVKAMDVGWLGPERSQEVIVSSDLWLLTMYERLRHKSRLPHFRSRPDSCSSGNPKK